jgi:hypothetical protein
LVTLKKALRGELDPAQHGWTNLQSRGFFGGGPMFFGGGGPFGGPAASPTQSVSLEIRNKDVAFVTLALNRFGGARVVPEDGTPGPVSLTLHKASVPQAVAQLAKQAHRNWTRLYVLRGDFGPGGPGRPGSPGGPPPQFAMRDGTNRVARGRPDEGPQLTVRDPNGMDRPGPPGAGGPGLTPEQREAFQKQRDALEAELMTALPAADRQKVQDAQQQREQQMKEMQSLTPEERRQRFAQMGGGAMDQRNRERIRNSTPEQRVEQQRRMVQMRQRMQQMQPPPRSP